MNLTARRVGNALILATRETRIDAAVAIQFKESFRELTRGVRSRIVLDLKGVEFVDSSGLGAIVSCLKNLDDGQTLELAGMQPAVVKVFALTRMDQVFAIHATADQAVNGATA